MHSLHMHSHSIDNRSKHSNSSMCTYNSNSSTANKPIHDMHNRIANSIMAQYVFWIDLHAVLYTVVIMQIINNWVSHADIWILEVTG